MSKYEISDAVKNNIIVFLNRAHIQGFQEIQAMNEITQILSVPIIDETSEDKK